MPARTSDIQIGLAENAGQFGLLVLVNAFVGAMVGLERAILPLLAEDEFGIASRTAILGFVAAFGLAKALANLAAGGLADRGNRRRILILGWLVGIPVPLLLIWAPTWGWIVFANLLLGVNQGLAWSATVIMKIDLVGPKQRGLAMGLNEAAGYVAVSLAALGSGYLAAVYGLRPAPFMVGLVIAGLGLLLSVLFVKDTAPHAALEAELHHEDEDPVPFVQVFKRTSWQDRRLFGISQAGLVNNLNDGVAWGLLPVVFAARGFTLAEIGWLSAVYPLVWGAGQLVTGALSDRTGRRPMVVWGMWVQAVGIALIMVSDTLATSVIAMATLGLGTAMVYPTLLAAIGDVAHPSWRASAVGVYRLWRDGGYVAGALLAGILADLAGLSAALGAVAGLTAISGVIASGTLQRETPPDVSG